MGRSEAVLKKVLAALVAAMAAASCLQVLAQAGELPGEPEEIEKRFSLSTAPGAEKSYLVPALEIPAFILLLNGFDRLAFPETEQDGKKVYSTNLSTLKDHLKKGDWVVDKDSFTINQLGHPYQGSMYHGFARSAGLNYWESLAYTNAGSFLWEMGGETTPPSVNDQVASGVGGSFIGEALFRMAGLVLEKSEGRPGVLRELCAAVVSPPTGFNRYAYGERFDPVFESNDPSYFWDMSLGASINTQIEDLVDHGAYHRTEARAGFSMTYGLPGRDDYSYTRPYDYFHFEFACLGNEESVLDNVMIHGLLLGKGFEYGGSCRGIWGLYGGFDYISPRKFRVSSTSFSLGTTFQYDVSREVALQGTVLGGVGFTAAGDVKGTGERDYRYGLAPMGLLRLRLICGEKAMLDFTGRSYYLTGIGDGEPGKREKVQRHHLGVGATFRVKGRHGIGISYTSSSRDARFPGSKEYEQTRGTFSVVYTLIGGERFGAVEFRAPSSPN